MYPYRIFCIFAFKALAVLSDKLVLFISVEEAIYGTELTLTSHNFDTNQDEIRDQ